MVTETQASPDVQPAGQPGQETPSAQPESTSVSAEVRQAYEQVDHRDWQAELENVDDRSILEHPRVRSLIARRAQSQTDRAIYEAQQRWQQQQAAAAERAAILNLDEEEVGKRVKQQTAAQIEWEQKVAPQLELARKQAEEAGFTRGYNSAYSEVSGALMRLDHWKGMSEAERLRFINKNPDFPAFVESVLSEGVNKRTEAEVNRRLKTLQKEEVREAAIEARATEPSPMTTDNKPVSNLSYDEIATLYANGDPRISTKDYSDAYLKQYGRR